MAALNADHWTALLGLIAPDELVALGQRGPDLVDRLTADTDRGATGPGASLAVEATFGPARVLATGSHSVPLERVTLDATLAPLLDRVDDAALAELWDSSSTADPGPAGIDDGPLSRR